jgi:hypothetical protein
MILLVCSNGKCLVASSFSRFTAGRVRSIVVDA